MLEQITRTRICEHITHSIQADTPNLHGNNYNPKLQSTSHVYVQKFLN